MNTITLSKTKYLELKEKAEAFNRLLSAIDPSLVFIPPVRSRKKIMAEFSKTGAYKKEFLASLAKGLKRSTFFSE